MPGLIILNDVPSSFLFYLSLHHMRETLLVVMGGGGDLSDNFLTYVEE
jgi:hypothetical protein